MNFQLKIRIEFYLNLLLRFLSILSVVLAVLHFGFNLRPGAQYAMVIAVQFIAIAFVVQEILRWCFKTEPLWKFLRVRWSETFILALLIVSYFQMDALSQMSEVLLPGFRAEDLLLSYLFVTQAVVAYTQLIKILRESNFLSKIPLGPSQLFVLGFAIPIFLGTLLLKLPAATYEPISWLDALFMATSAFCVTGLTVFDINQVFTPTGHVLLAGLFQLGGLGIMTLTMGLSVFFGGRLSMRERMYLGDLLAEERMGEVVKLLRRITYVTLLLELSGGVGIYYFRERTFANFKFYDFLHDWYHAISAFCNAGFSLLPPDQMGTQLPSFLWIITILVLLGGLGFPVLTNLGAYLSSFRRIASRRVLLTYTSKIVLLSAALLVVFGTALIYFAERNLGFLDLTTADQLLNSFFLMATSRTSGFSLISTESLSLGTAFLMIIFMWIGGGPMSTAGGVKTVTIAVAYFSLLSVLRGLGGRVEALGREINPVTVTRAHAVIIGSMTFIGLGTIALVFLEPEQSGINLLFEATSAFSTVGLSRGVTPELSDASKIVVTGLMFVGRVGLLTFLASWVRTREIPHYRLLKETFPIN